MQFNPSSNVTLFLSVRKGLESCILNEIKHNKFLNNFYKIHKNKFQNSQDSNTHLTTNSDYYDYTITEDITSYNTVTGLASLTNSLQLPEEFEDTNNKWLRIGHQNNSTGNLEEKTPKSKTTVSVKSNNLRDYLDINEQKGGLEIKCNFEWLIKSSLFLKSAESIWLRIGNPFRCHTQDQLTTFVSKLPWISYFSSSDSIDKVPLRIISRNSKLWSSHIVRDCVTRGIKQRLNSDLKSENNNTTTQDKGDNLNKTYSEDSCISVTINRNTCYAAIQFSGRLSPRFYNYLEKFNNNTEDTRTGSDKVIVCDTSKDYYSQIPLWSLSGIKKAISKSFNSSHYSTNLSETNLESYDSKRTNYIKFQKLLTNDFLDTSDSLIAAFLHNKHLLKAIDSDSTETIWDPFCGTGLVICELVSLVLSLPNYTLDNTNTITSLAKTFFTQNSTQIKSLFDQYTSNLGQKTKNFKIVGSDTSLVNLSEANSKILKFISYYNDILDSSKFEANDSIFSKNSTLYQSYSKLPVTIHNCSPEKLSHYMTNATIVTKFPYIDSKDKGKFETIKLCKLFGQVISSKSDWKGVFVISRGNFFEYHSGLEWKTLVKSTNSNSEIKLLEWTGRTRNFKSVQDKLDQLNEIDFV
ncbi:hypothetical protein TpMuguga_02g02165 [Theileria parva strain Muguga]|uniref:uncharacterized protein n=1 Tax=Theileria parva strain Muguga TaxID=333668 RepID=UPI001C6211F1|nr:uncharacterized protein TpMuguga_02g02165 [Theileria parva strain Muguga]KAF5153571.1 hypothetical protein TpMuguga_02g02165 [Theileria parva strain Muguga]